MQITWLIVYLFGTFLIARSYKEVISAIKKNVFLILLIAFVFISIFWSPFPGLSLRRSIAITLTTAIGIYVGAKFDFEYIIKKIALVYGLIIILSLLVSVIFPNYAFRYSEYTAMNGIFIQKNVLGYNMILSFLVWSWIYLSNIYGALIPLCFILISLVLLLLSKSLSSLLILFLLLSIYFYYVTSKLNKYLFWGISAFLTAAIMILAIFIFSYIHDKSLQAFFIDILGRDMTFSSRTIIWKAAWVDILKNFWFGYGYDAYWPGTGQSLSYFVKDLNPLEISGSHNGVLEIWLSLGLTGIMLFSCYYFQTLFRLLQSIINNKFSPTLFFMLLFIIANTLINLTENLFLERNSILWILFVAISVQLAQRKIT